MSAHRWRNGAAGILLCASLSIGFLAFAQDATPTATPEGAFTPTPVGIDTGGERNVVITETLPFDPSFVDRLQVPEGFEINVFAQGLGNLRIMAYTSDGTLLVTRRLEGDVIALADADGDGRADSEIVNVVASDLPLVHGITVLNDVVYLATDTTVYTATYANGELSIPTPIITGLPTGGQHPNRTLAFSPDGLLYITVGSTCNNCDDTSPLAATIQRANPDGSNLQTFASGLRNTIGFDWHPVTAALWGHDQGSDWLGDDIPPEEINRIVEGGNYGWPWCYGQQNADTTTVAPPPGNFGRAAYCQTTLPNALDYTSHAAGISLVFYEGDQFPAGYQNSAFITMRGSWNRQPPSGYEVVLLRFNEQGEPVGFEPFVTGFLVEEQIANLGRVAGLIVAPDGSLLITEDQNGVIYRVSYTGEGT